MSRLGSWIGHVGVTACGPRIVVPLPVFTVSVAAPAVTVAIRLLIRQRLFASVAGSVAVAVAFVAEAFCVLVFGLPKGAIVLAEVVSHEAKALVQLVNLGRQAVEGLDIARLLGELALREKVLLLTLGGSLVLRDLLLPKVETGRDVPEGIVEVVGRDTRRRTSWFPRRGLGRLVRHQSLLRALPSSEVVTSVAIGRRLRRNMASSPSSGTIGFE